MIYEPTSELYLCKSPLTNDYKNTLTFNNKNSQLNYFKSIVKSGVIPTSEYTFIRENNTISVEAYIENIIDCNYLFYKNNNKWYYCFITNMTYVNQDTTLINIETDVFQTWQFDLTYKTSFIEREHVTDDSIGANTVPENLELGEYIINKSYEDNQFKDCCIIVSISQYKNGGYQGRLVNGIYSGLGYVAFNNTSDGISSLNNFLQGYAEAGKSDSILSIFMCPKIFALPFPDDLISKEIQSSDSPVTYTTSISRVMSIDGYYPKNNKLFTFPYSYLSVTNNAGITAKFNYEDFENPNQPGFVISGVICPGISSNLRPIRYKNVEVNDNYGITGGKFPTCAWTTDVYTNWLTKNAVNIGISAVMAGAQVGAGIGLATTGAGALAGASQIGSGLLNIASSMGQIYEQSLSPYQAEGNINCGDVVFSQDRNTFIYNQISVRREYAVIIDNYFSMFGYKVNKVKNINIKTRKNWNFIKTIDANITGNCPQSAINIIKNMFNNGVTFWHNPSNIYNYNLDNSNI